jgi:hypothetical protein
MRLYDTVPVPHVFQIDDGAPLRVEARQSLELSIVLVGEANNRLPLVVEALAAAGANGLGSLRGRVLLERVDQSLPDAPEPQVIGSRGRLSAAAPPRVPVTPTSPRRVRIELLSPYKVSGKSHADGMDLGLFLMGIVRRVSLLQYFYTGRRLLAPFCELKAASHRARPIGHGLRRAEASRWAARHGRRLDTGGLIGHVDLDTASIEPLWPYLHLGQWLNIGKNASMGYGQYRLSELPQ